MQNLIPKLKEKGKSTFDMVTLRTEPNLANSCQTLTHNDTKFFKESSSTRSVEQISLKNNTVYNSRSPQQQNQSPPEINSKNHNVLKYKQ